MKYTLLLIIAFMVGFTALPVGAQPPINARQHVQKDRIQQGVQSGALTPAEANRLVKQERAIQRKEMRYRADGVLSPRERRDLQTDMNQLNRKIDHQKHDSQTK